MDNIPMMKRFNITELEALFYDLCSILKSDQSKHSADIIASKAVIYPRLDRMKEIISAPSSIMADSITKGVISGYRLSFAIAKALETVLRVLSVNFE